MGKALADFVRAALERVEEIDVEAAAGLIDDSSWHFVDVREPDEFAAGRVPGARNYPRGFLEVKGARGVGVEVFSLSRNFGAGNLPLAVVAGNRDAVNAVSFLSAATGLRPLRVTVRMAEALLQEGESAFTHRLERLEASRRILVETFTEMRWTPRVSPAVPFLWLAVPASAGAEGLCRRVLKRTGIRLRPGTIFGERGEGFVRASIPDDPEIATAVAERLKRHAHLYQRKIPRARRLPRRKRSKPDSSASE